MTQIWRLFLLCATGFLATPAVGQSADSQPTIQILVAYHSLSGNTERMAEAVAEGARMVSHTQVAVKRVGAVTAEELFAADAIVLGSPVYWSNMAGEVKTFIDDWQFKFGVFPEFKLRNKVGGGVRDWWSDFQRERTDDALNSCGDAWQLYDNRERRWGVRGLRDDRRQQSGD